MAIAKLQTFRSCRAMAQVDEVCPIETKQGFWGSWAQKPLCVSHFLITGIGFIQPPWLPWDFLGSPVVKAPLSNAGVIGSIPGQGTVAKHTHTKKNGQAQTVANQGREGIQRQESNGQMAFWSRVLVLYQGIHITSELLGRGWNPHQMGKVNCMLPTSMQTPGQLELEGWWFWFPLNSSPTNQKNVHELITACLNRYYKASHHPLQVWTHSFEGSLMAPFAWRNNKAIFFYFTQNSVSVSER